MSRQINRDTSGDDGALRKDSTVAREVEQLVKSKANETQAWQKIKSKYGNNEDLVQKIFDAWKNKLQHIYKKARKFKNLILTRYGTKSREEIVRKAKKYQRQYKFSDEEFDMFLLLAMTDKGTPFTTMIPTTQMAKTLGFDAFLATSKLHVPANEMNIVEQIVAKYGETKALHAQVLLQSLTYPDCAPEALSGKFDEGKKLNPYSYVHPIVAALFLPRIKLLDEQMIMSNIGYIVKQKANEQPVNTMPDFNLYWAMVTDPNDVACTPTNPVADLKNRYDLQTQLWDAVFHLRQGQYYYPHDHAGLGKFMAAIENCKNVIHDAPDLTYVKDEGTILRRLLSAFSLYPTYVSVNRLWGLMSGTQFGYPTAPLETTGFGNITRVPMITLRLPLNVNGNAQAVSLADSLTQPQWFVENKVIVPKSMSIVHSSDVLFFYVGRRYQTVNIARLALPYNFTNLPMTVTGWESLNEHPVNAPPTIDIMNDRFQLRSVVLVEKATSFEGKPLIVGSSAMVVVPCDPASGVYEETCILYDPQTAGFMYRKDNGAPTYAREAPVKLIPSEQPFNSGDVASFSQRARCRGTIFMYQKIFTGEHAILGGNSGCN